MRLVLQQGDLYLWHGVHAQGVIVGEILLLDRATLKGDFAKTGGGQAIDHTAEHLGAGVLGVDDTPQIGGDPCVGHTDLAVLISHFDDLRNRCAKTVSKGDTATDAVCCLAGPARHVAHGFQHFGCRLPFGAGQLQPELQRIATCGMGHLVDDAIGEEAVERRPDRAPETNRDHRFGQIALYPKIRDGQRLVKGRVHMALVRAGHRQAQHPACALNRGGLGGDLAVDHDSLAVLYRSPVARDGAGAVEVMGHVLFAAPR